MLHAVLRLSRANLHVDPRNRRLDDDHHVLRVNVRQRRHRLAAALLLEQADSGRTRSQRREAGEVKES